MKIYIDTNVLYDDWLLEGHQAKILEKYLSLTIDELCVSEVVIEELVRHFERKYKKAELQLQKISDLTEIIDDNLQGLRDSEEAVNIYRRLLENRLTELGARLLSIPDINIKAVLERDLNERKPFDPSGKGFRDSIIWETILNDCQSHNDQAVFISQDQGFMKSESSKDPSLHPDLISDLISNDLREDKLTIINNLKEFNDKYSREILDRVYRYGDEREGTFIEYIDDGNLISQYAIYFGKEVNQNLERLLSINMSLYEKVSLLEYPIDPILIEAYNLHDDKVLAIFIVSSLIDAYLFTDTSGYEKLISYTSSKGKVHFILEHVWDDENQKNKVKIRFSLHALISVYWNKKTKKGEQAHLVDFSFKRNDLWDNKNVS